MKGINRGINCFDPIEFFPPEIVESILNFLKSEDLCTASLVSTTWYNFIAESPECMKTIKIKVECNSIHPFSKETISLLVNSSRRYENLEISRSSFCVKCFEDLFKLKKKKWRRVKITNTIFLNPTQAYNFLEGIQDFVEELTLCDVYSMDANVMRVPTRNFTFPKLKVFRAEHIHSFFFDEAFQNIKNLQQFELISSNQTVASLNAVMTLLMDNHMLKVLELSDNVYNQVMCQDQVKNFKFKLKTLMVKNIYQVSPFHDDIQTNLVAFLKIQSESLETLTYGNWFGLDALKSAYSLKKLKNFSIDAYSNVQEDIEWQNVRLNVNNSIVKMNITNAPKFEMLKKLTGAAPKVTCFSVQLMDLQLVNFMSTTHKNLSCLSIGIFRINELTGNDLFNNLKRLRIKSFEESFKNNLKAKAANRRSHFERLLHDLF